MAPQEDHYSGWRCPGGLALAEKLYPTRHTTIGSIIDAGLRIHAFCLDCGHDEDLDMRVLARKLGRKHSVLPVHLVPRLVCSRCGSKAVGTVLAPADEEVPPGQVEHVKGEWVGQKPRKG